MSTSSIQDTLFQLCNQVLADPEMIPDIPIDAYSEESGERRLLNRFRQMLESLRQKHQEALSSKEAQYRSIFEATSDALLVNDLEGFVIEANSAACTLLGYSREELVGMHYSAFIPRDLHPFVNKYLRKVMKGKSLQTTTIGIRKDGSTFNVETQGTPFTYQGQLHILSAFRDITERKRAEAQLLEKEEQYHSIFEGTSDGLIINDLDDGRIVEVNSAACNMYGYTYDEFLKLRTEVILHPDYQHVFAEYIRTVRRGETFQGRAVVVHKSGSFVHVEIHGVSFMYRGKVHALSAVRDISEQVQAYQLLEQRVEERTHELSTLLEVSYNVAATIELGPLLELILDQLKVVVNYTGSSIAIVEDEDLVLIGTQGPDSEEHLLQRRFPLQQMGIIWERLCAREPVIIDNVRGDAPLAQVYRETVDELLGTTFSYIRSWLAVPLILKERVIGLLGVSHNEPNYYTPRHAALALAIANQAAVAIENAQLYEQAQELAAVEERQRLARELHDSVSQALYGISLGTHTARTLLDRDPHKVAEPLDYVLSLTEAALVEMRALIFELRPESLETEGLVAALHKQTAVLQARYGIEVSAQLCQEPDTPLKVKKELYRVAQEALHNIVKHAHASKVELGLDYSAEGILLEIRDNGSGFDASASFPGHLGLHSMRERITSLGGTLQLESALDQGTRIGVWLPLECIARRRTGLLG